MIKAMILLEQIKIYHVKINVYVKEIYLNYSSTIFLNYQSIIYSI